MKPKWFCLVDKFSQLCQEYALNSRHIIQVSNPVSWSVLYGTTATLTGTRALWFCSKEEAIETGTTSKEGSTGA